MSADDMVTYRDPDAPGMAFGRPPTRPQSRKDADSDDPSDPPVSPDEAATDDTTANPSDPSMVPDGADDATTVETTGREDGIDEDSSVAAEPAEGIAPHGNENATVESSDLGERDDIDVESSDLGEHEAIDVDSRELGGSGDVDVESSDLRESDDARLDPPDPGETEAAAMDPSDLSEPGAAEVGTPTATSPDAAVATAAAASPAALGDEPALDPDQIADLRRRWADIQTGFVDDPRGAVEVADDIVAEAVGALQAAIEGRRQAMAEPWHDDAGASTDALLTAFKGYRAVFDRVLSL